MARDNRHKLKLRSFRLDMKNFLAVRTAKQHNRLTKKTALSPSLEVAKTHLNKALSTLV